MLTSTELATAPLGVDAVTLVELLQARARLAPDATGYVFLRDGEHEGERLTYAELDRAARRVAGVLRAHAAPGDRALLLFPFGADYLCAFFGCLYASVVAMPAYPPSAARPERALKRLRAMMSDAAAELVLGTTDVIEAMRAASAADAAWQSARFVAADAWHDADASFEPRDIDAGTLAFLQYTSGSTGVPKGVMLTHANLMHNSGQIRRAFGNDATTRVVSWLPLYHDMGLIGGALQPLYLGTPCVLMSPIDFLQRPLRWLEAIARYRATTSGGPNFAYELCLRRSTPGQRAALDLSSWRVAFSGAEPVRADTLEAFAQSFAASGFDPRALYPCYGLAEATLFVAGGVAGDPTRTRALDAAALEAHHAIDAAGAPSKVVVACGRAWGGQDVVVVDPVLRAALADGEVGEIWVRGASIAAGYWSRADATRETFGARLAGGDAGAFLRTGDLGFVRDGQLYVTGRLKDLIILRGRNLYPQDIESTIEAACAAVHAGACAAIAVDDAGAEALAIVAELDRHHLKMPPAQVADTIRAAVAADYDAQVARVTLLRPGGLPKTSSGKLQRSACRDIARDDAAQIVWDSAQHADAHDEGDDGVAALASRALGRRIDDASRPLASYGIDSLAALTLGADVERRYGVDVPLAALLTTLTLAQLQALADAAPLRDAKPAPAPDDAAEFALSPGQRELWFESRRAGDDASAWHLAAAFVLDGALDADALGAALDRLVARHDALRVAIVERDAEPRQRLRAPWTGTLARHDASAWSNAALQDWLHAAARRPFDLERGDGALFAAHLLRREDGSQVLLFVAHHLVLDLASAATLLAEWMDGYAALAGGREPAFAPIATPYALTVAARNAEAAGADAMRDLDYWRAALAAPLPLHDLPFDGTRTATRARGGARHRFDLGAARSAAVRDAARLSGTTLHAWLLAAFQATLHRWSGADDLIVAMPSAGRDALHHGAPLGYHVRPVLARSVLPSGAGYAHHLARTREGLVDALAHRRCTYASIVDAVAPRDAARPELAHAWFVLQRASNAALGCLLLGVTPVVRPTSGGVAWSALPLDGRDVAAELSLVLVDDGDALRAMFEFARDLYAPAAVARLADRFVALVDAVLADTALRVDRLPQLAHGERERLLQLARGAERETPRGTLASRFFAQARRTPDAVALRAGDTAMCYGALAERVRRCANGLGERGVRRGDRVALVLPRSIDLVVAMLATLAADAVYTPVDPAHPPARVRTLLADARPALVVVDGDDSPHRLIARELGFAASTLAPLDGRDVAMPATIDGSAPAYLLYTSGSTGVPKGVVCTHAAALNLIADFDARAAVATGDACSWWTSASFDVSVYEVFGALLCGGTLCIADETVRIDPAAFVRWLGDRRIAHAYVPPFALPELAAAAASGRLPALRRLLVGVEPIPLALLAGLRHSVPDLAIINGYGPTEATICATAFDVTRDDARDATTPIGTPLAGVTAYVLDARGELAPLGVEGELYLGGAGLALGYWQRAALTAERFVPDAWSGVPGARLYRSGDRVRWRDDGVLQFLGRADAQIKLRGQRIEPGEIEAALRAHADVRDCAVVAHGDGVQRQLVAYVVGTEDVAALNRFLRERLPAALRPAQIVPLAALPLTAHGKLDRRALPAPGAPPAVAEVPPANATERTLAAIWHAALGVDVRSRDADFFALGGHSLLAATVVQRAAAAFGVTLAIDALFAAPTLAAFAQVVDARRDAGATSTPLVVLPRGGDLPVSFQQRRLWLLQQLEPASSAYNVACALRFDGVLDRAALARALDAIVARHEALRTGLHAVDGQVFQRVAAVAAPALEVEAIDEAALHDRLAQCAAQPFDLALAPLLRCRLFALAHDRHVLFLATHHAVFDGVHETFVRDLRELYRAGVAHDVPRLPVLAAQPADIADQQRRALTPQCERDLLDYWRDALSGEQPALQLPFDRARPARMSGRGAKHRFAWPAQTAQALREFARAEGVTVFAVALTAYQVLLSRLSGQPRVQVGSPVTLTASPQARDLVGCFVNTLVLRADVAAGSSFREHVRRTRDRVYAALAHQDLPFEALVDALAPVRDPSRSPLCQTMFVLQPDPWRAQVWHDLAVTPLDLDAGGARFDLLVSLWEGDGGLTGSIEYATDLFDAATIARIEAQFHTVLGAALATPQTDVADLPLLSPRERHTQLVAWNDTARAFAAAETIHAGFERRASEQPRALALIDTRGGLTYGELDAAANRVAHALRVRGIGRGSHVAVLLPRTNDLVVALLGVLKAGAAYVPLEASLPPARCAQIVRTVGAAALVTASALAERADVLCSETPVAHVLHVDDAAALAALPATRPPCEATADDVAYVIFTSGSTGQPKGVMVQHRPVVNLFDWVNVNFSVGPTDRLLFVTSPCFDLSVYDVFGALAAGASVRIASDAEVKDPERLLAVLRNERVTFWDSAPATLQQLVPLFGDGEGGRLRLAFLSGDWIPVGLPDAVRTAFPGAEVVSLGGATEAAIWSNFHRIARVEPAWASIPYGRPIQNARYYVLDARLEPQPVGVPGDLYIGGDCLALGYAAAPRLSAERFVPDPHAGRPGARMYRTGDLVRFESDGTMIFLGRADFQVKIRGFRIETGEIEHVVAAHAGIDAVCVVAREDSPGQRRLVAYVVPRAGGEDLVERLRVHVAAQLPEYMQPAAWVTLAALPLNANGKLDRHALPPPEAGASTAVRVAPRDAIEARVHAIWAATLGHAQFGVVDNYFDAGGHSLSAFQAVSQIRAEFGIDLPLRALFETPTVAALAQAVRDAGGRETAAPAAPAAVAAVQTGDLSDLLDALASDPLALEGTSS